MTYSTTTPTPTPTPTSPHPEPDDISAFLHHLLHRSSTASTSSSPLLINPPTLLHPAATTTTTNNSNNINCSNSINISNSSNNSNSPLLCSLPSTLINNLNPGPATVFSASDRISSFPPNIIDYCDYESEEAEEDEREHERQSLSRNQSKRTRAAEVHNLSEKRRRSRINEKMKALQNLIPNSNKTDKASMLDEAIEYLKQLQLQVQMLSMRNGMSLHPIMCLPEDHGITNATHQLSEMGRMHNLDNSTGASFDHVSITDAVLNINPADTSSYSTFNLANHQQCSPSIRRPILSTTLSNKSKRTAAFELESDSDACLHPQFWPFRSQMNHGSGSAAGMATQGTTTSSSIFSGRLDTACSSTQNDKLATER